jgi:hypothetical protein
VVRDQGELLGDLITTRRGEQLTPSRSRARTTSATRPAGLVLKNVVPTSDLNGRLVDLRASRQRLMTTQDDERRRLERNLHDDAQQHLVTSRPRSAPGDLAWAGAALGERRPS